MPAVERRPLGPCAWTNPDWLTWEEPSVRRGALPGLAPLEGGAGPTGPWLLLASARVPSVSMSSCVWFYNPLDCSLPGSSLRVFRLLVFTAKIKPPFVHRGNVPGVTQGWSGLGAGLSWEVGGYGLEALSEAPWPPMGPACSRTGGQERRSVWSFLKAADCSQPCTGPSLSPTRSSLPPGSLAGSVGGCGCVLCRVRAPETASNGVNHMEPAWPDTHSARGPGCSLANEGDQRRSQAGLPGRGPAPSPAPPVGDPLAGPRVTPHRRPDRSQRWWGHSGVTGIAGRGAGPGFVPSAAPGPQGTDRQWTRQTGG